MFNIGAHNVSQSILHINTPDFFYYYIIQIYKKKISHITQIFLNLSPISISLNSKNNFIFYFMVSDIYYFYAIK
jgi:hypothetical protein